jgi:peroxiredoxin
LQQVAGTLKEQGATLIAITPQLAEASRSLIEKQRITFDLLSDPGNDYATKLGLRFKLPDDLKAVYLSFGNDLAMRNGEGSWTLPMPGRFVIDRGGIVRAADVDPDYQFRPEPQKTVDDVMALA